MKKYESPEVVFHFAREEGDILLYSSETGDACQDDIYSDDFLFHF